MLTQTKPLPVLAALVGPFWLTLAFAQPKSLVSERPPPSRPAGFQPSVLCLPLPKLTVPAGSKPDAWVKKSAAPGDESASADLLDLDGDGTRDRFSATYCDGRSNCTVTIFVRRGDCGYYVGGFLNSDRSIALAPKRTLGLRGIQTESCHNRGCDPVLLRYDGYGYLEADDHRDQPPPLRVFPGVGIEQVSVGMPEAELLRLGFVVTEPGRLRKGPLEAAVSNDKERNVASIAYTEEPGPTRRSIDIITEEGGMVRTGEMSTSRIEELAEQIGRCGPADISTPGARTIHCQGGTLLRATAQGRTILISKKVPVPTARCDMYPGKGQGNAIEFEVSTTRSACLDGLHLSHDTPLERVLRAGCTSDTQSHATGRTTEARCGGARLLFAADGRTLRTIIPPSRP